MNKEYYKLYRNSLKQLLNKIDVLLVIPAKIDDEYDCLNDFILARINKNVLPEILKKEISDYFINHFGFTIPSSLLEKIIDWNNFIKNNEKRIELLKLVVEDYPKNKDLIKEINKFPHDCDFEIYIVTKKLIKEYLYKYLNTQINKADLVDWANFIECRDDIGFDLVEEEKLKNFIYLIANPEINYEIDFSSVRKVLNKLE